ncbi:hypothetical protein ACFY13_37995 [Streptomyces mirabilis]|uniref:hypothetical protein n=1 Tax=Streptomyces mirabilis TaxID=68239 RepID=UPI00369266D2
MQYMIPAIIASISLTSLIVSIMAYRNGGGRPIFKCDATESKMAEFKIAIRVINGGRGDLTVDFVGFEVNYFYGDRLKSNLIRVDLQGPETPLRLEAKSHEDWSYEMGIQFSSGLIDDGFTYAVFEVGGMQQRQRVKVKRNGPAFRKEFDLRKNKELGAG